MTGNAFLVRVQDRPGALERVLGTIRRKALKVEKVSFFPALQGIYELLLRTSPSGPPPFRVKAELESLLDVQEVRSLGASRFLPTRELAVVRVTAGSGPFLEGLGRLIGQEPDGDLLEITGVPNEVDATLAELADRDLLVGFHRTGEVPTPPAVPYGKPASPYGKEENKE